MNSKQEILDILKERIKQEFMGEGTGHDWFHVDRVRKMALKLAKTESGSDPFIVEAAALLHDIADHKFHDGDEMAGANRSREILTELHFDEDSIETIVRIVEEVSFKGAGVPTPMSTIEGKIVQDADRLDAIGAIGIARTFAYGGSKGRPLYDPHIKPVCHTSFAAYKTSTAPTINHFYEKLLLLKDLMNTNEAKRIASLRHAFMEDFLGHFYQEWDARDAEP